MKMVYGLSNYGLISHKKVAVKSQTAAAFFGFLSVTVEQVCIYTAQLPFL